MHFGGSLAEVPGLGDMGCVAMTAFALNLIVTVVPALVLNAREGLQRPRRRRPR